jgi:hypothetical protein
VACARAIRVVQPSRQGPVAIGENGVEVVEGPSGLEDFDVVSRLPNGQHVGPGGVLGGGLESEAHPRAVGTLCQQSPCCGSGVAATPLPQGQARAHDEQYVEGAGEAGPHGGEQAGRTLAGVRPMSPGTVPCWIAFSTAPA